MKPETVLNAAKLIHTGQVFDLAIVLSGDPKESFIYPGRLYGLYTKFAVPVPNTRSGNEEVVFLELGQMGTQIDALAHQMYGDSFYNCNKLAAIGTRTGFKKLGVEHIGPLMTRGVLIDVAALKGVDTLPETYVITPEDLQQALARQKVALQPGDAVIIHTGWGKLLGKDNARYGQNSPGLGAEAGVWLASQNPMLIGADNCCVDVRRDVAVTRTSAEGPVPYLPIHEMMLIQHGIYLLENLNLEELAAARGYEFAFVVQPLKIKGATGSTVAPIAIR
jgi:kynurenine formamidase